MPMGVPKGSSEKADGFFRAYCAAFSDVILIHPPTLKGSAFFCFIIPHQTIHQLPNFALSILYKR
jgi:hypothetical protein